MRKISGQSVIEYLVIMTVTLAAILSTGVIDKIRNSFETYLTRGVDIISPP